MLRYAVGQYPNLVVRAPSRLYEAVIGMEIHAQIRQATKLMSPAPAASDIDAAPNSAVHPIDAAFPGTMPRLSRASVEQAVRTGLAMGGDVQRVSAFDRKHYFYSDLPAGYQITQWQHPIVRNGAVATRVPLRDAHTGAKSAQGRYDALVRLERIQLEQDSGRSVHTLSASRTLVDLNRAGAALMEIVSLPDMRSPDEAGAFVRAVAALLRHIGTCDGQMENGSLRADVNVSVRELGAADYGERVEMKNLNSVRSVERAVAFEVDRQVAEYETVPLIAPVALQPHLLPPPHTTHDLSALPLSPEVRSSYTPSAPDMGWGAGQVQRETRSFDAVSGSTARLRGKEDAVDYRFLPEADIPPLILPLSFIRACAASLPALPAQLQAKYVQEHSLRSQDAEVIVGEPGGPEFFEAMLQHAKAAVVQGGAAVAVPAEVNLAQACANWLTSELLGYLHAEGKALEVVAPADIADIVLLVVSGQVSGKIGKAVLDELLANPPQGSDAATPLAIVQARGWQQITDTALIDALASAVIAEDVAGEDAEAALAAWPEAWRVAIAGDASAAPRRRRGAPRKRPKKSAVQQWLEGNTRSEGALVGRALALTSGKAAPELVTQALRRQLSAMREQGSA